MKKTLSLLLAFVMLFGTVAALSSCGTPKNAGAEISVYLGEEIYDFDPSDYYVSSNSEQLMSLLFEPLFRVNADGKLECAAAKKYSVDEEKRQIVIELRESYWSDEVRVTAADFIYAWRERIINPKNANPAAALFYDVENAIEIKNGGKLPNGSVASIYDFGAVASEVYEITITYREGADTERLLRNLASVATSPVRQSAVSQAEGFWSKRTGTILTNGAFKLDELDSAEKSFTLARNVGYHQPIDTKNYTKQVTPSKLVSFVVGEGASLSLSYQDIENKTVFYMLDASLEVRAESKDKATAVDDLSTYTYVFNVENPLFAIPEVRRALSLALDREKIAEALVFAKAATSFVSAAPAASLYGEAQRPISASPKMAEASALIKSVSSELEGLSKSFTLTVNNDSESLAVAELAKASWSELGFTVTVEAVGTVNSKVYDASTAENITIADSGIQSRVLDAAYGVRNFDVIAVDWQMYSEDPFVALSSFTSFMNGNGRDQESGIRTNISGWWSSEYDDYMTAAYCATTEEARREALVKAEALLLEACPIVPVVYNQSFYFASSDVSGVSCDAYGNFILNKMEQKNYELYLED